MASDPGKSETGAPPEPPAGGAADASAGASEFDRRIYAKIGRVLWTREYRAQHPEASRRDMMQAWRAARSEWRRIGRDVYRQLNQAGLTVQASASDKVASDKA